MATEILEQTNEELILSFLADGGEDYTPGEALCDKLGLSRTQVWKHVESLRAKGYRIEASPTRGYRLAEVPDRVSPLELLPLLSTHDLGRTLHYERTVSSTNDLARRLAEEGAAHGEVVIAEEQTAGRGRPGRSWASPPGVNLYCSVVLRPELLVPRAPELTLVAAVAIAEALIDAGAPAQIKWPNDLLVNGRKVGGILSELAADQDQIQFVILGIGVNLNARPEDFPPELRPSVTSLAEVRGKTVPRALFAAALFGRLEQWLDRHAEEGFGPIHAAWCQRSATLGQRVLVKTGTVEFQGIAEALDESGALLVRSSAGQLERITAGDVELRPKVR